MLIEALIQQQNPPHVSCVIWHTSCVIWHMSCVMCPPGTGVWKSILKFSNKWFIIFFTISSTPAISSWFSHNPGSKWILSTCYICKLFWTTLSIICGGNQMANRLQWISCCMLCCNQKRSTSGRQSIHILDWSFSEIWKFLKLHNSHFFTFLCLCIPRWLDYIIFAIVARSFNIFLLYPDLIINLYLFGLQVFGSMRMQGTMVVML